jgi:hypothetical protein
MAPGALDRRVKTALDETRLLILGAEILFGFHLNGAFQNGFPALAPHARALHAASFAMMAICIVLLIAPSLQHRIADRGQATARIVAASAVFAAAALFPFALSLGADLYIVIGYRLGAGTGAILGAGFAALALAAWFGAELLLRPAQRPEDIMPDKPDTPIDTRVEHMLTEARVLLPGAQALLGFQLAVMLTEAFGNLLASSKIIHVAALCCISVAVILLMAPAAFHRITFGGRNTERFHRLGSALVVAAAVPLGGGIVGDLYVAVTKALDTPAIGAAVALGVAAVLIALWLIHPLLLRARHGT